MIKIESIASAIPKHEVSQAEMHAIMRKDFNYDERAKDIFGNAKIDTRNFVLHPREWKETTWQGLCEVYKDDAIRLSKQSSNSVMNGGDATRLGGVIFCSCTGYLAPPPSFYIAGGLGLSGNIYHANLLGQGCSAFIPALKTACDYIRASGYRKEAIVVATETYSTCYSRNNDIEAIICNAIFADASVAAHLSTSTLDDEMNIVDFECETDPKQTDILGLDWKNGELSVVLKKEVPYIGPEMAIPAVERLLARNNIALQDINNWIMHCGGTKVLDNSQAAFGLTDSQMSWSWDIYKKYGNTSSTSVGLVLEHAWQDIEGYAIMIAFGPGFSCEVALLHKGG